MSEIIRHYASQVRDEKGVTYIVMACGERDPGGTLRGWLEFHPADGVEGR